MAMFRRLAQSIVPNCPNRRYPAGTKSGLLHAVLMHVGDVKIHLWYHAVFVL